MQTPRYLVEFSSICVLLIVMLINIEDFNKNTNNIILGLFAFPALRLLPSINRFITYLNNVKYAVPF